MSAAMRRLLLVSFAATVAGCVAEAPPSDGLQATQQPLQEKGVYYLSTTGTADNPAVIFYDQNRAVIGSGQSSQDRSVTNVQWQGSSFEVAHDVVTKDGAVSGEADFDALDTALTIFRRSLQQAFPDADPNSPTVHPDACPFEQPCQVPKHRCTGSCTGFTCSRQDGTNGTCINLT